MRFRACLSAGVAGLCVATAACETREPSVPATTGGGVETPAPDRFVVFARDRLTISRLGVPVPPPVTVGSSPSAEHLASDNPDVVMVTDSGELVARRNGTARVLNLAKPGDALVVDVADSALVKLDPEALILEPGQSGTLRLRSDDSSEISAAAAEWASDAPTLARVVEGRVEAGSRPGAAWISATYGDATVRARVFVRPRPPTPRDSDPLRQAANTSRKTP